MIGTLAAENGVAAMRHAAIQIYVQSLTAAGFRSSTIRQRVRLLEQLGPDPGTATREDVLRVIGRPRNPSAKRVYLSHLRSAYADMAALGLVSGPDPTTGVKVAHTPPPPPRPLTQAQAVALLSMPPPHGAWTVLGCFAGLRASEVLGLTRDDFDGQTLLIAGKGGRTGLVPAHPLVAAVMAHWSPPAYSTASHLSTAWANAARRMGHHVKFHQCRHYYGTRLLAATGDLMLTRDAMRHASVATTQRYLQVDPQRVRAAVVGL